MFILDASAVTTEFQFSFFFFITLYLKLPSIVPYYSLHNSVSLSQPCQLNHFGCFCNTKMIFWFLVKLVACKFPSSFVKNIFTPQSFVLLQLFQVFSSTKTSTFLAKLIAQNFATSETGMKKKKAVKSSVRKSGNCHYNRRTLCKRSIKVSCKYIKALNLQPLFYGLVSID